LFGNAPLRFSSSVVAGLLDRFFVATVSGWLSGFLQ
jgi:hypothetical protein